VARFSVHFGVFAIGMVFQAYFIQSQKNTNERNAAHRIAFRGLPLCRLVGIEELEKKRAPPMPAVPKQLNSITFYFGLK
jgi:hypothetical protein